MPQKRITPRSLARRQIEQAAVRRLDNGVSVEPADARHEKIVEHQPAAQRPVAGMLPHPAVNIAVAIVLGWWATRQDHFHKGNDHRLIAAGVEGLRQCQQKITSLAANPAVCARNRNSLRRRSAAALRRPAQAANAENQTFKSFRHRFPPHGQASLNASSARTRKSSCKRLGRASMYAATTRTC